MQARGSQVFQASSLKTVFDRLAVEDGVCLGWNEVRLDSNLGHIEERMQHCRQQVFGVVPSRVQAAPRSIGPTDDLLHPQAAECHQNKLENSPIYLWWCCVQKQRQLGRQSKRCSVR